MESVGELDYYALLELRRDASSEDIVQSYRRRALRYHPAKWTDRDASARAAAAQSFALAGEAYAVLSDGRRRALYDQVGERGLKEGAPNGRGGRTAGWSFDIDPAVQFEAFFGTPSPFAAFFAERDNNLFVGHDGVARCVGPDESLRAPGPDALRVTSNLHVTLEELYTGAQKRHRITRTRLAADCDGERTVTGSGGGAPYDEKVFLDVSVGRGWRDGTTLTFPGQGNEGAAEAAQGGAAARIQRGDAILTVKQMPHPRFRRDKNDLIYACDITLADALAGCIVDVHTLDDRRVPVSVSRICAPGVVVRVPGEGMPLRKRRGETDESGGGERGDLIITFNVKYPESLTDAQRDEVRRILSSTA